ncbi:MMPL family transporter [Klenkia taihuensis]|uniref:Putative drug exporter of the RND superfamily n=1 Tax=Klenkia taihuensis TaxID=1225127 RepID=A0A1I1GW08_9ACTN|nr:MMPL family transporter [Klenkia taihuensis]GHE09496.1 membrane protein [Klenkia taihuensis]SFC16017.1 putative drug exporter of the RND superfamily [Klenkia taihuensis]
MSTLLQRLGRASFRNRWVVVAVWVLVLAGVAAAVLVRGLSFDDRFTIPGSESQQALDRLTEVSPAAAGASAQVVFIAPDGSGVADPAYQQAIESTVQAMGQVADVGAVVDPFQSQAISLDGRAALANVQYTVNNTLLADDALEQLQEATTAASDAGLTVDVGGNAFQTTAVTVGPLEFVGVAVAVAVLAIALGSLLAAGMNLLTALVGVAVGLLGFLAIGSFTTLSSSAPTLALMIGLAVGIDYTLFILSRHRTQLAAGADPEQSAGRAVGTAGSAVVFAGLTVVVALAGLSVVGIPFLTVMGLGAAGTVLVAVAVALTLVPALMGFAGARLTPKPGSRTARLEAASASGGRSLGVRWAALVTRLPWLTALLVVAGLLVVALPTTKLELALPDNGTAAEGSSQRATYEAVAEYFGPGLNGPLVVLLDGVDAADGQAGAQAVAQAVGGTPGLLPGTSTGGLDDVLAAVPQQLGETTWLIQVIPESGPQDEATTRLVGDIRDLAPQLEQQTGGTIAVTGQTAVAIDVSSTLGAALVPFALVVVGLSVVLLLLVFRSVLVPVKAALGFLLSVVASFGAVVAVFQWGWLIDLFGVASAGPVVSLMPIILIAVLFGLAMDYEVFLVSRMREAYVHGASPREAVLEGMRHAARVVTAAALIMFSVFASFLTIDEPVVKSIAFGLAVGVLIDAFLVRMTLVPAVLVLMGRSAWWLPRWAEKVLPDLDVEGAKLDAPTRHGAHEAPEDGPREPAAAAGGRGRHEAPGD